MKMLGDFYQEKPLFVAVSLRTNFGDFSEKSGFRNFKNPKLIRSKIRVLLDFLLLMSMTKLRHFLENASFDVDVSFFYPLSFSFPPKTLQNSFFKFIVERLVLEFLFKKIFFETKNKKF